MPASHFDVNSMTGRPKFIVRHSYLFYKTFSKMTHLIETQRIEILILIGCEDKTR
jgi:hypothetical protein